MSKQEERNPYEDIIHLPHHQSSNRPHMSLYDRAAQFSPFAALTGFDGVIAETGRMTERKIELSEYERSLLDQQLIRIDEELRKGNPPEITVVYFVPDPRKAGGAYEEYIGRVRNIDTSEKCIVFLAENGRSAGKRIGIDGIAEIRGELVDDMEYM